MRLQPQYTMYSIIKAIPFPFLILALFLSCAALTWPAMDLTDPPAKKPAGPALKNTSDFLSYAKTVPYTNFVFGDSIKCMSGKLFKTADSYALIKTEKKRRATRYSLYVLKDDKWVPAIEDSAQTLLRINQRLEDFNFDGVLDFAFCDMNNQNGNKWYKLYVNQGGKFVYSKSFRELPNPIADHKTKSIKSSYTGSIYDQAAKYVYTPVNGKYLIAEMVTSDRLFDNPKVEKYKVCYYKPQAGKLTMQSCDTGAITLFHNLIPLK